MNQREIGRERGREAGRRARNSDFVAVMRREFGAMVRLYPTVGDMDVAAAIRDCDRDRLADEPDYAKFPELRGLIDRHLGEREGFRETSGLDETATAYAYSWWFFMTRVINCRYVARYDLNPPPIQCTNVFFPQGKEGVTISDNRDDTLNPWYREKIPAWRITRESLADRRPHWMQGGVSSAVLLDEEPTCSFPCSPHELMPPECLNDIRLMVDFMTRYREFWGPGNQLWVDNNLNAVAVEKSTCRVAYRWPTVAGAVCVTACSYIDPAMNAFKLERMTKAAKAMGYEPEESSDLLYSAGCDRRHRRLWELTNKEAARPGGATLWGALAVVADTEVPFPDRICLAGEKGMPDKEPQANWTLTQHASVITGPNRRSLYRSMQDLVNPRPIYDHTPKLVLGEGVAMKPEWQADIDAGRCELAEETATAGV